MSDTELLMRVQETLAKEANNLVGIEACLIGLMGIRTGDEFHEAYNAYLERTRGMRTEERMRYFRNKHTVLSSRLVEEEGYGLGV